MAEKETEKKAAGSNTFRIVAVAAFVIVAIVAVCFYLQYQKVQQILKYPSLATQMEANDVIGKVGKLIDLPKNEQPTIATVSDYTKLKDQPFFANAKNGDKVLIYTKAKKAILYDPVANKIVEVAPVTIGNNTSATSTPAPIRIAVLNGTPKTGATTSVVQTIKSKTTNTTISDTDKADKTDYTATIVIDLTGNNTAAATQLATLLSGQVSTLPDGQSKPANTDIVVIVGSK